LQGGTGLGDKEETSFEASDIGNYCAFCVALGR